MTDPLELIAAYRTRGLLLDANLLILYVAGSHDRRLLSRLKATRSQALGDRDLDFVARLVASFDRLLTTPHVLTEVNGMLNTGVPGRLRWDVLGTFSDRVGEMVEIHKPANGITPDPLFGRLGLTDVALLALAADGPLVISTDLGLCVALESRELGVINYTRIRPL